MQFPAVAVASADAAVRRTPAHVSEARKSSFVKSELWSVLRVRQRRSSTVLRREVAQLQKLKL